jgi:hypothetical protein
MIPCTLRTLVAIGVLAMVVLNAGCIAYRPIVTRPPTLGSELISLDAARSTGLLTDDEHAHRRRQTIELWLSIASTPIEMLPPTTWRPPLKPVPIIHIARIDQDITTGEKLHAIERARSGNITLTSIKPTAESAAKIQGWAAQVRSLLLNNPPCLWATVRDLPNTTPEGYSPFNPGLYAPVNTELADLTRALEAKAITHIEFVQFQTSLTEQSEHPPLRRMSESAPVAIAGTTRHAKFYEATAFTDYDDEPMRKEFQVTWIAYWLYGCQAADAKDSVAANGEVPLRGPFYIRDPNHAPDQWAESMVVFMVKPTLAK